MIGYIDIGALQHKDGGGDAANTGYIDIGALQHDEAGGTTTNATRKSRLFEGFKVRFVSGRIILHQK